MVKLVTGKHVSISDYMVHIPEEEERDATLDDIMGVLVGAAKHGR